MLLTHSCPGGLLSALMAKFKLGLVHLPFRVQLVLSSGGVSLTLALTSSAESLWAAGFPS